MKLTAPIYRLKRQARILSRTEEIPLHKALNRIARDEGFDSWSLLASRVSSDQPGKAILAELMPGDLVLLGARHGHGKTLLSLELAIEAMKTGQRSVFFTLEYNEADIEDCFAAIGENPKAFRDHFDFDNADEISAPYIINYLEKAPHGTVVVIDYLQLLDQKRENPELMVQVRSLRDFAKEKGLIIVFISQIHRSYDSAERSVPELNDVRLPNPLDLTLFSKACFLNNGEVEVASVR